MLCSVFRSGYYLFATSSNLSLFLATSANLHPSEDKCTAVPSPMPELAPVTSTTLPFRPDMMRFLLSMFRKNRRCELYSRDMWLPNRKQTAR